MKTWIRGGGEECPPLTVEDSVGIKQLELFSAAEIADHMRRQPTWMRVAGAAVGDAPAPMPANDPGVPPMADLLRELNKDVGGNGMAMGYAAYPTLTVRGIPKAVARSSDACDLGLRLAKPRNRRWQRVAAFATQQPSRAGGTKRVSRQHHSAGRRRGGRAVLRDAEANRPRAGFAHGKEKLSGDRDVAVGAREVPVCVSAGIGTFAVGKNRHQSCPNA
jgi:hypothetical protein